MCVVSVRPLGRLILSGNDNDDLPVISQTLEPASPSTAGCSLLLFFFSLDLRKSSSVSYDSADEDHLHFGLPFPSSTCFRIYRYYYSGVSYSFLLALHNHMPLFLPYFAHRLLFCFSSLFLKIVSLTYFSSIWYCCSNGIPSLFPFDERLLNFERLLRASLAISL